MLLNKIIHFLPKSQTIFKIGLVVFIFLSADLSRIIAQNVETISLKSCIKQALTEDGNMKKTRLEQEELELRIKENAGKILPTVTANSRFDVYPALPIQILPQEFGLLVGQPNESVGVRFGQPYNWSFGLELNQMIYNKPFLESIKNRPIARELLKMNELKGEGEVIYRVASNYYQILLNETQLRIIDANKKRLEKLYALAELSYKNQMIAKTDLTRIEINQVNLQIKEQDLRDGIQYQKNALKYLAGIDLNQSIELDTSEIDFSPNAAEWEEQLLDVGELIEAKLLKKQMELKQVQLNTIKGNKLPSLNAYAGLDVGAYRDKFNFFNFKNPWYTTAVVGLRLDIPIFDGFQSKNKLGQAAIQAKIMEEEYQQLANYRSLEYQNGIQKLKNTEANLKALERNIALAEEVLSKSTLVFKSGVGPLTDVLAAETALVEAQTLYSKQLYNYKIAELELLRVLGRLSELAN